MPAQEPSPIAKKIAGWIGVFFILIFVGFFAVCAIALVGGGSDDEVVLTPAQQAAADSIRAVEECLTLYSAKTTWFDTPFDDLIQSRMNDPDSYEKQDVSLSAVGVRRVLKVEFTGRNAFGGTVRHTATGYLDLDDCTVTLTEIE